MAEYLERPLEILDLAEFVWINCNCSLFGGVDLGVIGKIEFKLYLEQDSTNFGVPIVNFDYLQHYRLNGVCFRAIRELLNRFFH